jgi:hypothetical protein
MRYLIPLLLIARTAFGATADLEVFIIAPKVADADNLFAWSVRVTNRGPDAAVHMHITTAASFVSGTDCFGSQDIRLNPTISVELSCVSYTLNRNGVALLGASASSDAIDPNLSNNSASAEVRWIIGPNLGTGIFPERVFVDPALPFDVTAQYWNTSTIAATNTMMTIDLPEGATLQSVPDYCRQSSSQLICALGTVPGGTDSGHPTLVLMHLIAPDRREGVILSTHVQISATEPEGMTSNNEYTSEVRLFRTFVVDSNADSGSGSLRNAIQTANASCGDSFPCKVAFRVPATGVVTIRPETPLPAVTADNATIDGTTSTNRVFLDGSLLREGNGIELSTSCSGSVLGLAIGNFPETGITMSQRAGKCGQYLLFPLQLIEGNYIGVDPSGTTPAPNNRGIVVNREGAFITGNVISANRRSGIFIANGRFSGISKNVIGLDPSHRLDLGNGGSGIFVSRFGGDCDIAGNFIAFNHDFGIAIEANTIAVDIHPNSIFANWQMGIDNGLDGPTAAPDVRSAIYDPATDSTVIEISYSDTSTFFPTLQFYASDAPHSSGFGDGQYYLGTAKPQANRTPSSAIQFRAKGDWRGKWVSATITHNQFYGFAKPLDEGPDTFSSTSEFSRAVEVR